MKVSTLMKIQYAIADAVVAVVTISLGLAFTCLVEYGFLGAPRATASIEIGSAVVVLGLALAYHFYKSADGLKKRLAAYRRTVRK